jgi:hypothetical protein
MGSFDFQVGNIIEYTKSNELFLIIKIRVSPKCLKSNVETRPVEYFSDKNFSSLKKIDKKYLFNQHALFVVNSPNQKTLSFETIHSDLNKIRVLHVICDV